MLRGGLVLGTGTDVGKTFTSAALALEASNHLNSSIRYFKPIQTGVQRDKDTVASLVGPCPNLVLVDELYHYPDPLAPDQAAQLAGMPEADLHQVVSSCLDVLASGYSILEGAGGLLAPINARGHTWIDVYDSLRRAGATLDIFLVCHGMLGTINHTALSLQALGRRRWPSAIIWARAFRRENETSLRNILHGAPPVLELHAMKVGLDSREHPTPWTEAGRDTLGAIFRRDHGLVTPHNDDTLLRKDRTHVWHPYTQHQNAPDPLVVTSAHGTALTTREGRQVLDGIGSWWVNTVGHCRPEIREAIETQMRDLDHVLFAGITHPSAATLAHRLVETTGQRWSRVFFSDNGSTAVEVSLKIAYQFWNQGASQKRPLILALDGAYHGDTLGAMAVSDPHGFHTVFRDLHFHPLRINPRSPQAIHDLDTLLEAHGAQIAAAIFEPLLQGASGMQLVPADFLRHCVDACRRHGIITIADEVFTGLHRLGPFLACDRAAIEPDIVILSKTLTGGTLTLGATLVREEIYRRFLGPTKRTAFLHGHSFTANPIACCAALAMLDVAVAESLGDRALAMEQRFCRWLASHAPPLVGGRALGSVLAFEWPFISTSTNSSLATQAPDYFSDLGTDLARQSLGLGLLLRPLGNTLYLAPPLTASDAELDDMLAVLAALLKAHSPK